jgi:hypothetical protein
MRAAPSISCSPGLVVATSATFHANFITFSHHLYHSRSSTDGHDDSATARVVLKLQLDDVDVILKTSPKASNDGTISGERAAFCTPREELVKKWNEFHGQVFAYNIIKEENANQAAFKKPLSDEQQAEHKCRPK